MTVEDRLGGLVTFGKGAVASSSNKMTCNMKRSTETELIAPYDKLGGFICRDTPLNVKETTSTNA